MVGIPVAFTGLCLLTGTAVTLGNPTEVNDVGALCRDGRLALPMPLDQETLAFKCGTKFGHLNPSAPTEVYEGESASKDAQKQLKQVITEATLTLDSPGEGDKTLTVPNKHRPKHEVKLTYVCQKDAVEKELAADVDDVSTGNTDHKQCAVTITVHGTAPSEGEAQKPSAPSEEEQTDPPSSNGVHTCTPEKATEISVSEPKSEVKMKCSDNRKFNPAKKSEAFDAECKNVKTLSTFVPGAERTDAGDIHTLSIPSLPEGAEARTLCYQCEPVTSLGGTIADKGCQFRITVKAAEASGSVVGVSPGSAAVLLWVVGAVFVGAMNAD
ncbi:hypothetical protein BESB_038360 [Besnoitia besnoiti]|uniref:SRS domain-containing protein n=1 Tax=Besnoitia besnoiti TaxID=94643 RepID=A0A2A9MFV7_BESBE|nr:hypothetical protein BESB_038360 [Besnoitia besnoiti]PFH37378.1 hypothetical protein BESB_038360 [Besnoitia besnoiti]